MRSIARTMRFAVTTLGLGILAGHASANLTSTDYVAGSGDNWITFDSATQLQWLDVPLTANQTFDQVRTGIWYERGFRYATRDEVATLFEHAGTPDDGFDVTHPHPQQTLQLVQLLGPTLISGDRISVAGLTGTDFFGDPVTAPVGTQFSALLGKVDYSADGTGEAHFTGGHPFSDQADPYYGSFLVKTAVPEPSSILMLGLGMALMAAHFRARQNKG